ncbi:uncharacterized protein si:ch73-173p19.1 isoform X2 [Stegostoma tigrinum]|uniref:uncharacterized protein si:ch73-173p19.1 isoform X2 n=1 Tax=Stegostoma tigrinum TaxID=3053191 RepID=UPI00287096B7|nr:uncharacterized protein si:ch73-173p19.1 isoform X2 [Stegostoma tigrinum]
MEQSGAPVTINDLFLALYEMGFEEHRVQAALQAGIFSVQEATEWLLQGGDCTKHGQESRGSVPGAMSAFNPPLTQGLTPTLTKTTVNQRYISPDPQHPPKAPYPALPLSRRNPNLTEFEEQQREQFTQQIKAERRKKQKDHELALKRIADDRENLKAKSAPTCQPKPLQQGQTLEGKVQTAVEDHCILVIRLPSGHVLRERFRQDSTLQSVKDYVTQQFPDLQNIDLLQGFPKRHFTDKDLGSTLGALGLSPNATLCVRDEQQRAMLQRNQPPGAYTLTTAIVPNAGTPASNDRVQTAPPLPESQHHGLPRTAALRSWGRGQPLGSMPIQDMAAPSMEEPRPASGQVQQPDLWNARIPALVECPSRSAHFWGRGWKLAAGEQGELLSNDDGQADRNVGQVENVISEDQLIPPVLAFDPEVIFRQNGNRIRSGFEPQYQWPNQGNRLRDAQEEAANQDGQRPQDLPTEAAQAAMQRLNRAGEHEPSPSVPSSQKKQCRATPMPSLFKMATRCAIALMTAPSMQYSRSLACLTPELAEHLLLHMINQRLLRPKSIELFFGCQIQKLVLNCYPYTTNDLLRQLRAFQSLRHLSLTSCPLITDSGLEVVSSLQRLQQLNLAACVKLTDHCLCSLKGLNFLSHLVLDQTKVGDSGMTDYLVCAASSLVHLSLNQTGITERTLTVLPRTVPQLRFLSIKQTKVCDVSALKDLPVLHTLHLDNLDITETSLKALRCHPTLSSLSVSGLQALNGDTTLKIISGLKLTHLKLPDRHTVSDSGLHFLSFLEQLTELDLTDYTQVTDQGISYLGRLLRLVKLSLSNTLVTDAGLVHLQPLKNLEELCLDRTSISSKGVAKCIRNLPRLQVLSLASTCVGDSVVSHGLLHCRQLLKVNLSRTRITDRGLRHISQTSVSQLNLDGTGVTLPGISSLVASCPGITSIRINNLRTLSPDQVSDDELTAED